MKFWKILKQLRERVKTHTVENSQCRLLKLFSDKHFINVELSHTDRIAVPLAIVDSYLMLA